jgi:quinol monooxygenase YgiN
VIVIAGTFHLKAATADMAIEAMLTTQRASAAERGCNHYRFMRSLEEPLTLHVFEEWTSLAALGAHYGSDHNVAFNAVFPSYLASTPIVEMYDTDNKRPLADPRKVTASK